MGWVRGQSLWIRAGREPDGVVFVIRRALGTAVVRNRLKRRLRHILRELDTPVSGSIVLLARPPAVTESFAALRGELLVLLRRQQMSLHAQTSHSAETG